MHREIMQAPDGVDVDHIDTSNLNNTRQNLRVCTHGQNTANRRKPAHKNGTHSRFKGVTWHKSSERWVAQLRVNYRLVTIGYFKDEREAALAYNEAARKHFGEFARLNEVD